MSEEMYKLHTKQIKNRLPIEKANKVQTWPQCLSAVSWLKTERNNLIFENKELQSRLDDMQTCITHNVGGDLAEDLMLEGDAIAELYRIAKGEG